MEIGHKIKSLRESIGMTQSELAQVIQSTKQTIFKYENGIITNIPMDKLEKIANVLDVTPAYLMGWDDVEEDNFTQDEIKIIHTLRQNPEAKSILELIFSGSDEEIKELSNYIDFILSKRR